MRKWNDTKDSSRSILLVVLESKTCIILLCNGMHGFRGSMHLVVYDQMHTPRTVVVRPLKICITMRSIVMHVFDEAYSLFC